MRHLSVFRTFLLGRAQQRPVLYPNPYSKTVGQERSETEVDECTRLASASEHAAQGDAGDQVAGDTAKGAVVGGATGAAVGAVLGSAGRGAAAGAGGGAAGALTQGLFPGK